MDNSTAQQLEAMQQQMENQVVQLREAQTALVESWHQFQHVVEQNPLDKTDHGPGVEGVANAWEQAVTDFTAQEAGEILTQVKQLMADLDAHANEAAERLRADHENWTREAANEFNKGLEEFSNLADSIEKHWQDDNRILAEFMQKLEERLKAEHEKLASLYKDIEENIAARQHPDMNMAGKEWQDTLTLHIDQKLPETMDNATRTTEQVLDHLMKTSQEAGKDMGDQGVDLMNSLSKHIGESVKDTFEECTNRLVEECMARLIDEGQKAIVDTTFGAQVTTALSPLLPQLITLKKATDAIKHAIEVYKRLKDIF